MFAPISAGATSYYDIPKSLRFRGAANAYVSRTPAIAGNRKTWTWSGWLKRGTVGVQQILFAAGTSASNRVRFYFNDDDTFSVFNTVSNSNTTLRQTTAVFRDPLAAIHLVVAWDSTQATANDRLKVYINGGQITSFSVINNVALNNDGWVFSAAPIYLGHSELTGVTTSTYDGLVSEFHMIEGLALGPGSFGYLDMATNSWRPKKYTGSYGGNGSYLPFDDGNNLTTLGQDRSGNGNNWTCNGISLTAGATYDWMDDTPTNNYATINPLDSSGSNTVTAGNLTYVTGATFGLNRSTFALTSGKWYWEVTGFSGIPGVGVSRTDVAVTNAGHTTANGWAYFGDTGNKWTNNSGASYGMPFGTSDVVGVALDMDVGTLTFYKNGVSQGTAFSTGLEGQSLAPMLTSGLGASGGTFNFGQRPFAYTPPTGFKALCTKNLPEPSIKNPRDHFDILQHVGNGGTKTVSGTLFQPGLAWTKNTNGTFNHVLRDVVRGANRFIYTNTTSAEAIVDAGYSFDADGISIGASGEVNANGSSYVDWLWKAGGAPVANNVGSIASQVSANVDAGFSIVTYTGTGANATVGHGLGVVPKMVVIKETTPASINNWVVYHEVGTGNNSYLYMNLTDAKAASATVWNNTPPTSSVFSIGTAGGVNGNAKTFVAYCFAEIPGYSKIGSFVGNSNADGPFVYCGFRPAYVMVKVASATSDWLVYDTKRNTFNATSSSLYPNLAAIEANNLPIDVTATGFKIRHFSSNYNLTGATHIFYAVAEQSLKYSNAR